eukprot:SAG31_NODE_11855_length_992_cov_0.856663_1_plen_97_part_10
MPAPNAWPLIAATVGIGSCSGRTKPGILSAQQGGIEAPIGTEDNGTLRNVHVRMAFSSLSMSSGSGRLSFLEYFPSGSMPLLKNLGLPEIVSCAQPR